MMQPNVNQIMKIDNQISYAIGHRNLVNIAVMLVGAAMIIYQPANTNLTLSGMFMLCTGMLFFAKQVYENIDEMEVSDMTQNRG